MIHKLDFKNCTLDMNDNLDNVAKQHSLTYKINDLIFTCKKCTPEECKNCCWDANNFNKTKYVPKEEPKIIYP